MKFERITTDPGVFGGKPCVRGMRFPVSRLLGLLASGESSEEILEAYPYLEEEDIRAAMRYERYREENRMDSPRSARGMWKGRDDLPDFEVMRREFDGRFASCDDSFS